MLRILTIAFLLSCTAATARADVYASDGAVIINNSRYLNGENNSRSFYRQYKNGRDDVIITNGRNSGAVIVQDGKTIISRDGTYNLKDGQVDIKDGRVNGRVGSVDIRN